MSLLAVNERLWRLIGSPDNADTFYLWNLCVSLGVGGEEETSFGWHLSRLLPQGGTNIAVPRPCGYDINWLTKSNWLFCSNGTRPESICKTMHRNQAENNAWTVTFLWYTSSTCQSDQNVSGIAIQCSPWFNTPQHLTISSMLRPYNHQRHRSYTARVYLYLKTTCL